MSTALVIGLGTSGLHIIEECQQFHYQFTGKNKPDAVRYLYLETDVNQKATSTAMGQTDIQSVYISLQNIGAQVNHLRSDNRLDHSWIPPVDEALAAGNGAGGNSSYGRLALWINYQNVRSAILQNWQQIHGDQYTYIFIVGTLTGGTGSGTCVDIAYLVRSIINSNNVFGLFLTPTRQQLSTQGTEALFYNYYSAITAIQHYSDSRNPYDVVWPDGSRYHNNTNPFKQCYFLSQDYTNMFAPIQEVPELYKVAGLHIFSRIHSFGEVDIQNGQSIPNFSETIDRRLLDMQANVNSYKFSTFGTKLIYYPKELLKELFGLKLSKQVLEQWSDTENFIDKNSNKVPIQTNNTQIKGQAKQEFEKMIVDCLNIVDGKNTANGITLLKEIETTNVNALVNKNYQAPNANSYIYRLFTADNDANHFALVNNNRLSIRDQFIDNIYEMLKSHLDKYQNLSIGNLILEAITESIDNVLSFWLKEYKIDGQQSNWNGILQKYISIMMTSKSLPTLLAQRKNYFKEQFVNILMLCKMHIAVEVLMLIKDTILSAQTQLRSQKSELPTIPKINGILSLIAGVINYNGNDDSVVTLQRRENQIKANLTTNTPNFSAVFAKGSLDNDIEYLETNYKNNKHNNRFGASFITNNQSIWSYLEKVDRQQLFTDSIVRSTSYVNVNIKDLQNETIVNLIKRLKQTPADRQWQSISKFIIDSEVNIRTAIPGLVEIRANIDVFQPHNCLKLIYLNGNIPALQPLMQNYNLTATDCNCELPGLNDAIIVFQEYGYMGGNKPTFDPVINIGINSTVSQSISQNIDYINDDSPNSNTFLFKRRVPYLTQKQFNKYIQSEVL
jgi:hypothetical protein